MLGPLSTVTPGLPSEDISLHLRTWNSLVENPCVTQSWHLALGHLGLWEVLEQEPEDHKVEKPLSSSIPDHRQHPSGTAPCGRCGSVCVHAVHRPLQTSSQGASLTHLKN